MPGRPAAEREEAGHVAPSSCSSSTSGTPRPRGSEGDAQLEAPAARRRGRPDRAGPAGVAPRRALEQALAPHEGRSSGSPRRAANRAPRARVARAGSRGRWRAHDTPRRLVGDDGDVRRAAHHAAAVRPDVAPEHADVALQAGAVDAHGSAQSGRCVEGGRRVDRHVGRRHALDQAGSSSVAPLGATPRVEQEAREARSCRRPC
jgi:hypothetical protein